MDLGKLLASDQAVIELKHPVTGVALFDDDEKPKALSLTIVGHHTRKYKDIAKRIGYSQHKRNKNLNAEDLSPEETFEAMALNEADDLEAFAEAITDCNILLNGEKLKCTKDNMIDLLSDERFYWIKNQYIDEVRKGAVFFKS